MRSKVEAASESKDDDAVGEQSEHDQYPQRQKCLQDARDGWDNLPQDHSNYVETCH